MAKLVCCEHCNKDLVRILTPVLDDLLRDYKDG